NTRPRYSWVIPRSRPWPTASTTVTPTCPVCSSTASITVSTRSRMTTASTFCTSLRVVVEGELRWMGPEPHGVDLVRALVRDPGLDQLLREDAASREDRVVGLGSVETLSGSSRKWRA